MASMVGTQRLGEDILMARHGDRIVKMRHDRKSRSTVATLADGTTDSAPDSIIDMPAVSIEANTPVHQLARFRRDYAEDKLAVSRRELRLLGRITAVWTVVAGAVTAGSIWLMASTGNTELMAAMMGGPYAS
jgi:hypothetical protein